MERMVNNRLIWWIENNDIIHEKQSGFRKKRRCLDNLIDLEENVTKAFNSKQDALLVSFDLKKAYDRVRQRPILEKLVEKGLIIKEISFIISKM